jgi:hypothetical protein
MQHRNNTTTVLCSISVVENLEVTQLAKKFPVFMKFNIHYHAPKSAPSLDPILQQFSPSYPFMLGHLKSHFHASITVCINLQSSLFT